MEINGNNPLIVLNNNVQRLEHAPQAEKSREEGAALTTGTDRIELSVKGREFAHLDELINSIPDVRESKIELVQKELEQGTYNVRAEKIAEKIIKGNLLDEIL
jgi:flagellar biosynthesis anti-sigma factor FlgM